MKVKEINYPRRSTSEFIKVTTASFTSDSFQLYVVCVSCLVSRSKDGMMRSQHFLFAFSQRDLITQDRDNIPWMKMDLNWNSQQRVLGVALPATPLTRLVRVLVRQVFSKQVVDWVVSYTRPPSLPCGLIVWSVFTKAASHSAAHTALIPLSPASGVLGL